MGCWWSAAKASIAFSHLTFQEYLAARAVSDKADYVEYTLKRLSDSWWREVVLLEAGYLSMQGKQRATALIQAIMDCAEEPEPYHNLVLAAECVRDVGQARVTGDLSGEVQRRLRKEFETPLPLPEDANCNAETSIDIATLIRRRAAAAEALGRIESGAGTQPAFWRLPFGEPVWVDVPAGEFCMGGDGSMMATSTSRELACFQDCQGADHKCAVSFLCRGDESSKRLEHWQDGKIPRGMESHPVVNVSWHDALKYCEWLSTKIAGKAIDVAERGAVGKSGPWAARSTCLSVGR